MPFPTGEAPRAHLLTGHRAAQIRHHAVTADGAILLTCGDDGLAIAWDVARKRPRWVHTCNDDRYGGHGFETCVILDDRHAVLGSSSRLRIVRLDDGATVRESPGSGLVAALPGGRLLLPQRHIDRRCMIIDAWTHAIIATIGSPGGPGTATVLGDLILLTSTNVYTLNPLGVEAWHATGSGFGTRAWRREGTVRIPPCRLPDGSIALLFEDVLQTVDPTDGRALLAWEVPAMFRHTCELHVANGQLVISDFRGSSPVLPEVGIADPTGLPVGYRRHDLFLDCWHRPHADATPADPGPQLAHHGWLRPGVDCHPIAITAHDDGTVALATSDGTVQRWRISPPELLARTRVAPCPAEDRPDRLLADSDVTGATLTWADAAGTVCRIDVRTGETLARIATGITGLGLLAVSRAGDCCVVSAGQGWNRRGKRLLLLCFDLPSGNCRWRRRLTHAMSAVFAADGRSLLVASPDRINRIATADGSLIGPAIRPRFTYPRPPGKQPESMPVDAMDGPLVLSRSGTRIAVGRGHDDPVTWMTDTPTAGTAVRVFNDGDSGIAISSDDRHVATADNYCSYITVLDTSDGTHCRLSGHQARVTALTFTPDGTRLISAGDDGYLIVWRTSDWTPTMQASLLPTAEGQAQNWWARCADGTSTGSAGFQDWLNPLADA